jgi:prepilin-type N-terminal cleavage/methylation domain-containing protein
MTLLMREREGGFTVIEILLALAIFAVVITGALGALGAQNSGQLETIPTGLVAARSGKDMTAAAVYLQALHECAATVGGAAVTPGTIIYNASSTAAPLGCTIPNLTPPPDTLPLLPSAEPYQLARYTLTVSFDTMLWPDPNATEYVVGTCSPAAPDCVVRIRSTLAWSQRGDPPACPVTGPERGCLTLQRLLPR